MKKEEKTKLTREKIIKSAIIEFGTKSYEVASLNTICSENQISKGLIYHNFENKDTLYLTCVERCYREMINNLNNTLCLSTDIPTNLKQILNARQDFFEENPYYRQIFFTSVFLPPKHLLKELKKLRSSYDECLKARYKELLSQIELRKEISVEQAVNYLMTIQEMFNGYFRDKSNDNEDIDVLIETHEIKLSELLNVILYGIVDRA